MKHAETGTEFRRGLKGTLRDSDTSLRVCSSMWIGVSTLLPSPGHYSHICGRAEAEFLFSLGRNLDAEVGRIHERFQHEALLHVSPINVESIKIIEHTRLKKHRDITKEDIQERRNEMKRRLLRRRRSRALPLLRYRTLEKEKMMCPVAVDIEVGQRGTSRY